MWGLTNGGRLLRIFERSPSHRLMQTLRAGATEDEGEVDVDESDDDEEEEEDDEEEDEDDDEEEEEEEEEEEDDEEEEAYEDEEEDAVAMAEGGDVEYDQPVTMSSGVQFNCIIGVMLLSGRLDMHNSKVVRFIR